MDEVNFGANPEDFGAGSARIWAEFREFWLQDRGADALEVLDEFLEANPKSLIPHLKPMLELCLQVSPEISIFLLKFGNFRTKMGIFRPKILGTSGLPIEENGGYRDVRSIHCRTWELQRHQVYVLK